MYNLCRLEVKLLSCIYLLLQKLLQKNNQNHAVTIYRPLEVLMEHIILRLKHDLVYYLNSPFTISNCHVLFFNVTFNGFF